MLASLCARIPGCGRAEPEAIAIVDLAREVRGAETRPSPASFAVADVLVSNAVATRDPNHRAQPPDLHARRAQAKHVRRARRGVERTRWCAAAARPVSRRRQRRATLRAACRRACLAGRAASWTELRADLSPYAGWQWSVFYRPETRRWRLVLSADAVSGTRTWAAWGVPSIVGDRAAAREYVERSAKLGR